MRITLSTSVYTTLRRINVSSTFHPPFFLPSFFPSFPPSFFPSPSFSPFSFSPFVTRIPRFISPRDSPPSSSPILLFSSPPVLPPPPRSPPVDHRPRFRFRSRRGRKGCVPRFVSRATSRKRAVFLFHSSGRGDSRCGYTRSGGRLYKGGECFN